ncbi:MAG: SDR family NAD(P)-dependent oxidoreductase [Candidatus Aminicenantales bacterium]
MSGSQLAGRVALVTGANHGIGAATAKTLAADGAAVFITCYRPPSSLTEAQRDEALRLGIGGLELYQARQQQPPEKVVADIIAAGGQAACLEADLADPAAIPKLFDACESRLGPAEILVNDHARCEYDTFDPARVSGEGFGMRLTDASLMDEHYAVNARGTALMMVEFAKRHIRRGAKWGRIINISTDAADAHAGAVSYAASKHAMESYSRSAAHELGQYGITVNIVAPGPVQTGWLRPDQEVEIARKTPLGRVGRPDDIADVVAFLASDQARWLTGQLLYVGGGWKWHP